MVIAVFYREPDYWLGVGIGAALMALVLALSGCGGNPTGPPDEREWVDLVLEADSTAFVQTGVDLNQALYGVTAAGDTVYNPSGVSFDLPDGFYREGDRILAQREAVGAVVAHLNPSDSTLIRVAHHLDSLAPWRKSMSCYNLDGKWKRTSDDTMLSLDSMKTTATIDSVEYVSGATFTLQGHGFGQSVFFWEDGQVDTTSGEDYATLAATQSKVDTLALDAGLDVPAVANAPRRYRKPPVTPGDTASSVCGSSWERSGEWILEEQ